MMYFLSIEIIEQILCSKIGQIVENVTSINSFEMQGMKFIPFYLLN